MEGRDEYTAGGVTGWVTVSAQSAGRTTILVMYADMLRAPHDHARLVVHSAATVEATLMGGDCPLVLGTVDRRSDGVGR